MLVLAAGLVMTMSLIGFSMYTFNEGKKFGNEMAVSLNEVLKEEEEYKYLKYEEGNITGGEVIRAVSACQDEIKVTVVNGSSRISYTGSFKKESNKPGNAGYIALSYIYKGRVNRDLKGVINEIVFTKV